MSPAIARTAMRGLRQVAAPFRAAAATSRAAGPAVAGSARSLAAAVSTATARAPQTTLSSSQTQARPFSTSDEKSSQKSAVHQIAGPSAMEDLDALCKAGPAEGSVTVAYFTAQWCGPCKMVAPHIEKLAAAGAAANKSDGQAAVKVAKIDIDAEGNEELCEKYGISSVPTFVFLAPSKESSEGPKEITRTMGADIRRVVDVLEQIGGEGKA